MLQKYSFKTEKINKLTHTTHMSICIFTQKKKKKKLTYDGSWFCLGRANIEFDLKI